MNIRKGKQERGSRSSEVEIIYKGRGDKGLAGSSKNGGRSGRALRINVTLLLRDRQDLLSSGRRSNYIAISTLPKRRHQPGVRQAGQKCEVPVFLKSTINTPSYLR